MNALSRRRRQLLLTAIALGVAPAASASRDSAGADELITRVVAARQTIGYRVRAQLVRTTAGSEQRDVKQLLIKGRRRGDDSKVLYQVLWPAPVAGQTVVIEKTAGQDARAWMFTPPDHVASLNPHGSGEAFFGSDLTIEDLAEEFWHWPTQEIVGEDSFAQRRCKILVSRPPAGAPTSYALVRTWVAPDIALPLFIEEFGKDGALIKHITAERITQRRDDSWTAARVVIEPADRRTRTVLEGSRADRDIEIPDADFTVERIKASLPAAPPATEPTGAGSAGAGRP